MGKFRTLEIACYWGTFRVICLVELQCGLATPVPWGGIEAPLLSWPFVTGDLGIFIRILLKCDPGFEIQVMSPLIFCSPLISQSMEVEMYSLIRNCSSF